MTYSPTPRSDVAAKVTSDCACPDGGIATALASRRTALRGAGLAGLATVFGSAVVSYGSTEAHGTPAAQTAQAAAGDATLGGVIVVLSMRGACDGLSLVVPHGDPVYYQARPQISIDSGSLLAKDGMFGLHPELRPLLDLWNGGKLAAVHATGLRIANRSHFSAMEEVEDADPGSSERVGWLNRLLGDTRGTSPVQGIQLGGGTVPTSMLGPAASLSLGSLDDSTIAGEDQWDTDGGRRKALTQQFGTGGAEMGAAMRAVMAATDTLEGARKVADNTRRYPNSDLGRALADVSRTIKGDVGLQIATVDHGDWDMHTDIGTLGWGRMKRNVSEFAEAIAAFFADLAHHADRVTLVTISEFGRRVQENANWGLDHGWGNVMFVAGAGVKGGRYYGTWPGLENSFNADLTVTTDYRSVLAEVISARSTVSTARVFPHFNPETHGFMRTS